LAATVLQLSYAQEAKGDAAAGEKQVAQCIGCHGIPGYQASFPEIYRVPMLFGQSDKYIVASLNAYKKGERKHPSMRGVADNLNAQEIADIAAYYSVTKSANAKPKASGSHNDSTGAAAALIQKGGCQSCHGGNLNSPVDPAYPKIAGQYADYLYASLRAYKVEGNPKVGRSNAVMGSIAKQFSRSELKLMAEYVASLPGDLETIPQRRFK
jgi:cytochrome c553